VTPAASEYQACRFLRTAFEPDDWIAVLVKPTAGGPPMQRVTALSAVLRPEFHRWLRAMNAQRCHIFVSVNTLTPRQRARTREAVRHIRHIMLDCDRAARDVLTQIQRRLDLPTPSYVVRSSPGRAHILWRVREFTPSVAERLTCHLAREFGTDPVATACTQLTRLPGYRNHKRSAAHVVAVRFAAAIVRSGPAEFPIPATETSSPSPTPGPQTRFAETGILERARRYAARVSPAIAGCHGDLQTFKLACALVQRLGLADADALAVLVEWNAGCQPPWTVRELRAKIEAAHKHGR
jgi:hypothetical protein